MEFTIIIDAYFHYGFYEPLEFGDCISIMYTDLLTNGYTYLPNLFSVVKQKKKERSTISLPKFKATSLKLWCHRVRKM